MAGELPRSDSGSAEAGQAPVLRQGGLVEKVSSHKPGLDALRFLVEHDEAFIDDLLFVAGRAAYADIILLEEMHVLDRKLKTYSLRPQLKPYVEDMVAPALRVI